jgi:hypothetical protein
MTFRKGVSGNPRGRPRIVADIRDLCRKFGAEGVELLADIARDRDQPGRARGRMRHRWNNPWVDGDKADPFLALLAMLVLGAIAAAIGLLLPH